ISVSRCVRPDPADAVSAVPAAGPVWREGAGSLMVHSASSASSSPAARPAGAQLSNTKTTVEFRAALVAMAIVALIPLGVSNPYWLGVLIVSMYFAILAGGWNLLAGYTGQFSLAPATFAMIGAYTTGLLGVYFGVPPLPGILAAIVVSGLVGLVLGRAVLRLVGPYLALTTLSFAEIMRLVASNTIDITRGDLGLGVPGIGLGRLGWYYLFLAVLVVLL